MTSIRIDLHERLPFAGGMEFDAAGAYERLRGRVHFAVDPEEPAYAGVVDLDKAPRDADGRVAFASDLSFELAPQNDDNLVTVPLSSSEVGALNLSGGIFRLGLVLRF